VKLHRWKPAPHASDSHPPAPSVDWALLDPRAIFAIPNRTHWESEFRRLTFNAVMAKDAVLCRILGRYKVLVSNADEGLGPHLIGDGYWEVWTTRFIAQRVQPGMVCIDAGANLGYYTVLMADMCGPDGRVIAAEPVPQTRDFLTRNVALNGFSHRVEIRPEAFGAEAGEVSIAIPRGEPKNALVEFAGVALHPGWEWDTIKTPMVRIDDLNIPKVDFIKIDVEGAEEALWRGMAQTLDRSPDVQIVMEVNYPRYADPEAFFADIASRFPLRRVDFEGEAAPITVEEIRDANDDVMLYLSRN
jgi:FkbM family methyltransferase